MAHLPTIQFIDLDIEISFGEVFELIGITSKNLERIERLAVQESGLTPSQYHVLNVLWEGEAMPQRSCAGEPLHTRNHDRVDRCA